MIELDVKNRRLHLDITDAELKSRLAAWKSPVDRPNGGYAQLYHDHVQGADKGADMDFLVGCRGNAVGRESH
jgi:L-arabonate dehydrase